MAQVPENSAKWSLTNQLTAFYIRTPDVIWKCQQNADGLSELNIQLIFCRRAQANYVRIFGLNSLVKQEKEV